MDLVVNHTKPKIQRIINIFTSILSAFLWLTITYYSVRSTLDAYFLSSYIPGLLHTLKYPVLMAIPIGSFFLAIQAMRDTGYYLKNTQTNGKTVADME